MKRELPPFGGRVDIVTPEKTLRDGNFDGFGFKQSYFRFPPGG